MSFAAGADTVVNFTRDIWSVSRLNAEVRAVLEGSFPLLWVQGELSNLSQPASGHIYFTLKDEAAQVRCAMFRFKRRLLQFKPANGEQVLIRARIGLYEPRGDYQLIVEHMEPAGEGALRVELERRKQRLAAEGLFDADRKRRLPAFPRQVGLITSASGAALHDLLTVLRRRQPLLPVLIFPAQVQGEGAAETLIQALELANRRADCDLLILARGGGSLEDLMAFNDEGLVRVVAASEIPVITGIGHEVDVSLADLAADRRGATPSAAAELAAASAEDLLQRLNALGRRLTAAARQRTATASARVHAALRQLKLLHPALGLQQQAQTLDRLEQRAWSAIRVRLVAADVRVRAVHARLLNAAPDRRFAVESKLLETLSARLARVGLRLTATRRESLASTARRLDSLSPLATLSRGYAIASLLPEGRVIRNADAVPLGARIAVKCHRGSLHAVVTSDAAESTTDHGE